MLRAGWRLVRCEKVELEVAADAKPDELGGVELGRHATLFKLQHPCVERSSNISPVTRNRDRNVLEFEVHDSCSGAYDNRVSVALDRRLQDLLAAELRERDGIELVVRTFSSM
jgi:hypothetical protein